MLLVFLYIYCAVDHDDGIVVAGFMYTEREREIEIQEESSRRNESSTFHFIQVEKLVHLI